jgi:TPP-dependent 2-oxoacid decarboxylase
MSAMQLNYPKNNHPTKPPTHANWLLQRLVEFNLRHIFAVSANQALVIIKDILISDELEWVECLSGHAAGFAANSYAKLNGCAVLFTTTSSAYLNAQAALHAAYNEYIPLIHLVLKPTQASEVSLTSLPPYAARLSPLAFAHDPGSEVDRLLQTAIHSSQPVEIALTASEFSQLNFLVPSQKLLPIRQANYSDQHSIAELKHLISNHPRAILVLDLRMCRFPQLRQQLQQHLAHFQLPIITTAEASGTPLANYPNFVGIFNGSNSQAEILELLEHSSLIIHLLPPTDIQASWLWTNKTLRVYWQECYLGEQNIPNLWIGDVISQVLPSVNSNIAQAYPNLSARNGAASIVSVDKPQISEHLRWWAMLSQYLTPSDIVICDQSVHELKLTQSQDYTCHLIEHSHQVAASYSLASAIGAGLASPHSKIVVITTSQELLLGLAELAILLRRGIKLLLIVLTGTECEVLAKPSVSPVNCTNFALINLSKLPNLVGDNLLYFSATKLSELQEVLYQSSQLMNSSSLIEINFSSICNPILDKE